MQLEKISLLEGWLPTGLFSITGIALILLFVIRSKPGKHLLHLLIQIGVATISFFVGGAIAWLVSDVFLVFGVSLGWLVIISVACGFGLIGFAVAEFCLLTSSFGKFPIPKIEPKVVYSP